MNFHSETFCPPSSFLRTSTGGFLRRLTTNWFEKSLPYPLSKMEKKWPVSTVSPKNSHYDKPQKSFFLPIGVFGFHSWNRPRASHLIRSLCECLTQNVLPSQASSLLKNRYIHNASSKPDWNLLKQFHIPKKTQGFWLDSHLEKKQFEVLINFIQILGGAWWWSGWFLQRGHAFSRSLSSRRISFRLNKSFPAKNPWQKKHGILFFSVFFNFETMAL